MAEQPAAIPAPDSKKFDDEITADEIKQRTSMKLPSAAELKHKLTTKEGWIGDYDYGWLCMPTLPCLPKKTVRRQPPFYGVNDSMPILLAVIAGFQHMLAMIAGLVTPPIIFSSALNLPPDTQAYLISASLIISGILSAVQMSRFRIPGTKYFLGTGLLTVVGTSFATLPVAFAIFNQWYAQGKCPSTIAADGTVIKGPCPDAYGALLGTSMVCALFEILLSFLPRRLLRKAFPPMVTGIVVFFIGASLVESGFQNWGGGSSDCHLRPETGFFSLCPNIAAPNAAPWGSAQFLGLGFLVFITIIIIEYMGSPAMRNASVVLGLAVGMIVAGATGYVSNSTIQSAPAITFLWVKTFKLSVYGPAVIPMLAAYVVLLMEATGDVTATSDVSRVEVDGEIFDSRIQGGVLADGVAGLISGLATMTPMSIFAQNNGVIALTRCANRIAGYFCCLFLVILGVLGKVAGVFLAIPPPVLGGMTTFLFASVAVSGLRLIGLSFSQSTSTRRTRFILTAAMTLGLGNLLNPTWASYLFTYSGDNQALLGFYDALEVIIGTPYLIGAIIAIVLNLLLPNDSDEAEVEPVLQKGFTDPVSGALTLNEEHKVEEVAEKKEEKKDKEVGVIDV
ncbi:hypothetical protein HDV00_002554 [Rhizophlyctis rosea]|nr:hypothetical protein HDV00_002554 [Rhizophlyctis rosea]